VESAHGSLLLSGDIGHLIEARLLRERAAQLRADIVLVPHHGSAGSSSQEFVAATGARHSVFAVGHDNRFGHPRAEVVARWRDTGAQLWNTARHGALRFELGAAGIEATSWRQAEPRLWRAPVERD
jgi:competence protein ComEC